MDTDASQWLFDDHELDYSTPAPLCGSSGPPLPNQRGRRRGRANVESQSSSQVPDEILSKCRPYTIIWTLYKKKIRRDKLTGDTVQNIDCYPSVFWETSFKSEIDAIIKEKKLTDTHEPDETQIVVSINARGVEDITMRSPGLDIDWSEVNEQIDRWSDLVGDGKKLIIRITFIFKENSQLIAARTDRRGRNATNNQLGERAAIHNDQDATDEVPLWEQVYDLLECPGAGCDIGPYCWRNPATGIRHAVPTSILTKLVQYAERGGKLKEHSDVPKHYQNEILNPPTKKKQVEGPQINITNVMPGAETAPPPKRLKIAGHRDKAIERYCDWHCKQVDDPGWKKEFHAIAKLTFQARLPLDRLFEAQEEETKFFVSHKIPRGIAHQWVSMVDQCKELEEEK
ncbi:LOW QUALITY PROTEIN: hypothetical protein N5P37_011253 [Trichoderma harzianum]|nr:LOW QUALITY PROTEIN: hypothetical protein N5P37_011253 [Trichoderma harzianum]